VLGVSVGTVKSAVSRALAKLREDAQLLADVPGGAEKGVKGVRGVKDAEEVKGARGSGGRGMGDLRGLRDAGGFEKETAVAA
jgi:hypothetical protein